jgi:FkbM family methyltransferase
MAIKRLAKGLFRKMGYLVESYNIYREPSVLLVSLLSSKGIDVVFDIGANEGQFASGLRRNGYKGTIVSFEPVAEVYEKLCANARGDAKWKTVNCALGSFDGKTEINVAMNTVSSSLLNMLPRHLDAAPQSRYVRREGISVRRIDAVIDSYLASGENAYVKMDTQGLERQIIEGADGSLERIWGMQLELSLVPLYQGETLIGDMINLLSEKDYALLSIEPAYRDGASHEVLQVDAMFFRRDRLGSLSAAEHPSTG